LSASQKSGAKLGDARPETRGDDVGCQLGQRIQHEQSLREPWMRDLKAGPIDATVTEEEDVKIEGARAPSDFAAAIPAVRALNREQLREQIKRFEFARNLDDGVEVRPLGDWSDRVGLVNAGSALEKSAGRARDCVDGRADDFLSGPDVGADGDENTLSSSLGHLDKSRAHTSARQAHEKGSRSRLPRSHELDES